MQARLHGPDREAQGRRDFGQRHPQVVVQDDDGATLLVESPEDGVDLVTFGDRGRHVRDGRRMDGRELDLDRPPATAAGLVDAGVDGEAMEPGLEPVGVAKRRQVTPGPDEASWTASRASSGSRRMR